MPLRECQEIFNTFGELGNADLLCKYGFTLPDNPFSSVQLSKDHYCSVVTERLGSDAFQERAAYVEEQRYIIPFMTLSMEHQKLGSSFTIC